MKIPIELSIGETIDKLSIINVKLEKIDKKDPRIKILDEEKKYIESCLISKKIDFEKNQYWQELLEVNRQLYEYDSCSRKNPDIAQHKRGIYWNDLRHLIKNKINSEYNSSIEVKLHENLACDTLDKQ
jgi:hypothetical protein